MGRDVHGLHRCLYATLNVNPDVALAERELRTFIESYYGIPYEVQATRNGLCAGSAEHCISRRLLLLGHRPSWSASGVRIRWDNWRGLPKRFCRALTDNRIWE
jgi:hypothetical protein